MGDGERVDRDDLRGECVNVNASFAGVIAIVLVVVVWGS